MNKRSLELFELRRRSHTEKMKMERHRCERLARTSTDALYNACDAIIERAKKTLDKL